MLYDGDFSFLDRFVRVKRCGETKFRRIELRFCADMQRFCVEQIPLAWLDLAQAPIISADIGFCGELSIAVGFVHIHELLAVEYTVFCSGERSIALWQSFFTVGFGDGEAPFFEDIVEVLVGHLIPLDYCCLFFRHHIFDIGIFLFESIRRAAGNEDILKNSDTRCIGHSVFIHRETGKGGAVKMKFYTFNHVVLGGLDHLEVAAFENVVECYGCRLPGYHSYSAALLRLIFVFRLFGYGVNSRIEMIHLNLATVCRLNSFIYAIALNAERNPVNLAVLGGFYDFCRAVGYLDIEMSFYRIVDLLCVGDGILQLSVRAVNTVRPSDDAAPLRIFLFCGNRDGTARRFVGGNRQFVSAYGKMNTRNACGERIVGEHIVFVGERSGVLFAVPFQFDILRFTCGFGEEARQLGMVLDAFRNGVVVAHNLTA